MVSSPDFYKLPATSYELYGTKMTVSASRLTIDHRPQNSCHYHSLFDHQRDAAFCPINRQRFQKDEKFIRSTLEKKRINCYEKKKRNIIPMAQEAKRTFYRMKFRKAFRRSDLADFLFVDDCYLTVQKASVIKIKGAMVEILSTFKIGKRSSKFQRRR
jgi:hypothetical protein